MVLPMMYTFCIYMGYIRAIKAKLELCSNPTQAELKPRWLKIDELSSRGLARLDYTPI